MKFPWTKLPKGLSGALGKVSIWGSQHAPAICLGAGLVCFGSAIAVTAVQSLKADEVIAEHEERMEKIHKAAEMSATYTKKDRQLDTVRVYGSTVARMARLYALPGVLTVGGTFLVLYAHGLMRRRYAALAAAYTTLERGYAAYRKRVVDRLGPEADYYFRTGVETKEINTIEIDPDTGESKPVVKQETRIDPNATSMYARYFDEHSREYQRDLQSNLTFLRGQQAWFNHLLAHRGYVMLNEVYEALDIPPEPFGQVVGWFNDPTLGDPNIDFGLVKGLRAINRTDGQVYDKAILLDFNVHGPVWERIQELQTGKKHAVTPVAIGPDGVDRRPYLDI